MGKNGNEVDDLAVGKKQLQMFYIISYKFLFRLSYSILKMTKKNDEKKAVFVLSREMQLDGNLKYIHKELINQLEGAKIHFVIAENKMNLKLFQELWIIADARYLILDDYYLPVYLVKPDKGLKVIQLWHAAGAFKKFGHSTVGTKFGPKNNYLKWIPIHANYTHVYVSSKNAIPFYAEAFNMSISNIYSLGIPRIDLFNDENLIKTTTDKIYTHFPNLDEQQINILFAPTYRATGLYRESDMDIVDVIVTITKQIKDNIRIIFKAHPYMPKREIERLKTHSNVLVVEDFSINEWMLISDAFITDYSSSIFDFALLKRPLAHFVPDIGEYKKNRGLYKSIEEISDGTIILNLTDLLKWINARNKNENYDTTRMVAYNFDNTNHISKAIVSHLI